MEKVIIFPGARKAPNAYVKPPKEVIEALFTLMHGIGDDYYEIMSYRYSDSEATLIDSGIISTEDNVGEIEMHSIRVRFQAEARITANKLRSFIGQERYCFRDNDESGFHYVFVAGDNNVFYSFGWYDSQKGAFKGSIMAVLLAYAFAYLNVGSCDSLMVRTIFDLLYSGRISPLTEREVSYEIEKNSRSHHFRPTPKTRKSIRFNERRVAALVN